ncbi:hypothetical protein [Helicobacter sp. 12S02634-8]|uniref:hypothetical protein n=1 Tax=Helicobacter sp. 12S02634-8 TaxID=1476199 RepID=UPI00117A9AD1|nr:hypothetical protein [Helicobacter sp. 12S02634-8]
MKKDICVGLINFLKFLTMYGLIFESLIFGLAFIWIPIPHIGEIFTIFFAKLLFYWLILAVPVYLFLLFIQKVMIATWHNENDFLKPIELISVD